MKFDVIYSLGKNCACSEYLKKHNLRLKAGPFDWIVSADNYAPFECILDEFNLFSDFSYLKVISQYDNTLKVEHSKTKYLFLHDFFTNSSLSSQINPIHDKYQRRKEVRERYKEYDGCYLGHYAQWFFWFFFTIGIFVVAGGIGMIIAQNYGK